MDDHLMRNGLYFDEGNQIRILDPESTAITSNLSNQCSQFINGKGTNHPLTYLG